MNLELIDMLESKDATSLEIKAAAEIRKAYHRIKELEAKLVDMHYQLLTRENPV